MTKKANRNKAIKKSVKLLAKKLTLDVGPEEPMPNWPFVVSDSANPAIRSFCSLFSSFMIRFFFSLEKSQLISNFC